MKSLILFLLLVLSSAQVAALTSGEVSGKYNVLVYNFTAGGDSPAMTSANIALDTNGVWMVICKETLGNVTYEYPCYSNSWLIDSGGALKVNTGGSPIFCNAMTLDYLACYLQNAEVALFMSKINSYLLVISKVGNGSGTVLSNPSGIKCGDTCSADVKLSQTYTLLASPDTGSLFGGWSGCDSSTSNSCTVITSSSKTITATFSRQTYYVAVTNNGPANGVIKSDVTGINCGTDDWGANNQCTGTYNYGETVTLTATPLSGKTFSGWSFNECTTSTATTCSFTVSGNKTITVSFN